MKVKGASLLIDNETQKQEKRKKLTRAIKKNMSISSQMIDFTIRKSIKEKGEEKNIQIHLFFQYIFAN